MAKHTSGYLSVYVGCNEAVDAINTMRTFTHNPVFDKNAWRVALLQAVNSGHSTCRGVCKQDSTSQFEIQELNNHSNATIHCIEAMPMTANVLKMATSELKFDML
jgi:hypothetical protein